jgi:methylated-DNA-protein-cysteine methyltransferase related protein
MNPGGAVADDRRLSETYRRIYAAVRRVPAGRVATYGDIAAQAGLAGQARLVGYALHALPPHSTVPWHRILNAQGRLSLERSGPGGGLTQQFLLESEGIEFDATGRVPLARFRHVPRPGRSRQAR